MAQSSNLLVRLQKVEKDVSELKAVVVQITELLVEQSERMDAGFRSLRTEMRDMHESLNQRFDRLIDMTMRERTEGADRLSDIERRLSSLEAWRDKRSS